MPKLSRSSLREKRAGGGEKRGGGGRNKGGGETRLTAEPSQEVAEALAELVHLVETLLDALVYRVLVTSARRHNIVRLDRIRRTPTDATHL